MCGKAVRNYFFYLEFVSDWFVTWQQVKIWHDDNEYHDDDDDDDDDRLIKCYDGYLKRKAQKTQIKKELMHIAWHPSSWWDWCVPEDKKK